MSREQKKNLLERTACEFSTNLSFIMIGVTLAIWMANHAL